MYISLYIVISLDIISRYSCIYSDTSSIVTIVALGFVNLHGAYRRRVYKKALKSRRHSAAGRTVGTPPREG